MKKTISRRDLLSQCLQLPIGGGLLLGLTACGQESSGSTICADENTMTAADKSLRRTLGYTEKSPDSAKTCSGCDFFKATPTGCGTCEIFTGKPVNPSGYCTSWSPNPEAKS